MEKYPTPEDMLFESAAAFEAWLADNHDQIVQGIWLLCAKKGSGVQSITYPEAVEIALCWGWIDGQVQKRNEKVYAIKCTPRRPRSVWSKINREKIAQLIAQGRMQPSGLREVERAQADGRWDAAYDPPSTATVPEDLQAAIDANPAAAAYFATITKAQRYSILYRVQDAKRPETRASRIVQFVEMLARGEGVR